MSGRLDKFQSDWFGNTFKDIDDLIGSLVIKTIKEYRLTGHDLDIIQEDLQSAGWMGACKAKELYGKKVANTAKFTSYAYYEINGQIRRAALKHVKHDELGDGEFVDYRDSLYDDTDMDELIEIRAALDQDDIDLVVAHEALKMTIPQMKELTGDKKIMERHQIAKDKLARTLGKEAPTTLTEEPPC